MSKYEIIEPKANSIVSSLRSIGYSLETAIADLIDNSISAQATRIKIDSPFDGVNTKIMILDDGYGMSEETLVEAMRLGSTNPNEKRKESDLGRFGLGLKTASFSQCKKLIVITKHRGVVSSRTWDLDVIEQTKEWRLISDIPEDYVNNLNGMEHGTIVIWEKLDRIIFQNDRNAESNFASKMVSLRSHLALVFHRFLEKGSLKIFIGGGMVFPWNPFLPQTDPAKKIEVQEERSAHGNVIIRGWVMPHRSNFQSEKDYKDAGYNKGWTQMQGFYIYRADRLLLAGGWLGLKSNGVKMKQERFYDLARISIDITNGYDFDWDIDIKKSKAAPPDYLRSTLENYAKNVRKKAYEVYNFRAKYHSGKKRESKDLVPLWSQGVERNNKLCFKINQDNLFIKDFAQSLNQEQSISFNIILKLLSETIPIDSYSFQLSDRGDVEQDSPFGGNEDDPIIKDLIIKYMNNKRCSEEVAREQVLILLNI